MNLVTRTLRNRGERVDERSRPKASPREKTGRLLNSLGRRPVEKLRPLDETAAVEGLTKDVRVIWKSKNRLTS